MEWFRSKYVHVLHKVVKNVRLIKCDKVQRTKNSFARNASQDKFRS